MTALVPPEMAKEWMKRHATRRFFERAGFILTDHEYEAMCVDVHHRQHELVARGYRGRIFVPITYKWVKMLAIFDTHYAVIVSFIDEDLPAHTARRVTPVVASAGDPEGRSPFEVLAQLKVGA